MTKSSKKKPKKAFKEGQSITPQRFMAATIMPGIPFVAHYNTFGEFKPRCTLKDFKILELILKESDFSRFSGADKTDYVVTKQGLCFKYNRRVSLLGIMTTATQVRKLIKVAKLVKRAKDPEIEFFVTIEAKAGVEAGLICALAYKKETVVLDGGIFTVTLEELEKLYKLLK